MKKSLQILVTSALMFSFSSIALADYYFKGRVYKLSEYDGSPPKYTNFYNFKNNVIGLPRTFSLKEYQTPVKNQGSRGSCAYFSTAALTESLIMMETGKEVNISEEYLIYHAKAELGYNSTGDGSNAYYNLKAMRDGFFLESDVPYGPSWFDKGLPCEGIEENRSAPTMCYAHKAPEACLYDRMVDFKKFRVISVSANSSELMKKMFTLKAPIAIGLPLNPRGWDRDTGYCEYNEELRKECNENPNAGCGGHSVLLTGYDMNQKLFYFKNSWGYDWGDSGYGTLSFDYIDLYARSGPVTASYKGALDIPDYYDQEIVPSASNVDYDVTVKEGNVQVKMVGLFGDALNRTFYASTFIASKKDINQEISDYNAEMMMVPENLNDQYGYYVRGYDYVLEPGVDEIVVDNNSPFNMEIPKEATTVLPNTDYFLRISAYYYDDIEGWNVLFREYEPVEL